MLPINGCDPKLNVYFIGGIILKEISYGECDLRELMQITSSELDVSIDHIILSLDWLFMISAINVNGNTVTINEAQ
ncbi:ABC-three component system middle component 6 [Vibrio cyclitrophicus]|uniref:ABC-three component system middle component 6 n=1 Tax=Vibrio cyclitrophicus TaxID=47951 RepID=UPI000C84CF06|nr:hypothetical protein BCV20_11985 [Vibrio cyclitrophicus]